MLSCLSLCFCILLVKGCWLRVGAVAEYMWGYGNEMAEGKLKPGGLGRGGRRPCLNEYGKRGREKWRVGGWVAKSLLTVGCEDLANSPFAQPPRPHPPPPPSRQPDGGYLGMRCLLYFV